MATKKKEKKEEEVIQQPEEQAAEEIEDTEQDGSDAEDQEVSSDSRKVVSQAYEMAKSFKKGDKLYHAVWEEEGVVEETGLTEDGFKKMIVRFPKKGRKKLIMEFSVK